MDVIKYLRPRTRGDLVLTEYDQSFSRDAVTFLAGSGSVRTIPQFAVLSKKAYGAQTVTAGAAVSGSGATPGNGAIGTVTADANAPEGGYRQVFIEPAADAGEFEVFLPDGTLDGAGKVGVAYNGTLNFTQADGSTDFVAGDFRTITVAYASGRSEKFQQIDFSATDGAQNAAGIAPVTVNVPDGTDLAGGADVRGPMIVRAEELVWPVGATTQQKNAAIAQLQALNPPILVRVSG